MTRHLSRPRTVAAIAALCALGLLLSLASGCSFFEQEQPKTVTDPSGLFHFKVPGSWQSNVTADLIAVYAAKELPESGSLESLSILVYSGTPEDTSTPVEDRVTDIIALRAENREWESYETSDPEEVTIGGRPGTRIGVEGVDSEGAEFSGAYHLVRTSGKEVLVIALSPGSGWESDEQLAADVFEQWFWLKPE